ncbi:MAG: hypothetical protein HY401_07825 [Elusimicrobia bacterium]|nr:hypothetical protein [Elusimicrobiota bacterium]
MMRWAALSALLVLTRPGLTTELDIKQSFGRSSLAFVLDEEEEDARFTFWSVGAGLEQGDDKAKTRFKVGRREKDFKTRNSSLLTNRAEIGAYRKQDALGETIRWGGDLLWRSRSFDALSVQNYQEYTGRTFAENFKGWSARLTASHFAFEDLKNENKLSLGVKKSFPIQKRLTLSGDAKLERHWAQNRRKFKNELGSTVIWKPQIKHWSHARLSVDFGQRDTKAVEDREDNLDFSFWEIGAYNTHPLNAAHDLAWKLMVKEKDDKGGLFSHRGNSGDLQWRWNLKKDFPVSQLAPSVGLKRMKFSELPALTYTKQTAGVAAKAEMAGWNAEAAARLDFYNFPNQKNRRRLLNAGLDFTKPLTDKADVSIGAHLRHSLISFNAAITLQL